MNSEINKTESGDEFILRIAKIEDALQIYSEPFFESEYIIPDYEELNMTNDNKKQKLKKYINNKGLIMFVAEKDQLILGWICFEKGQLERRKHHGYLSITVHKEYRGIGIGKTLLNKLLEWVKNESEIHKVYLTVLSNNKNAIQLYESCGFRLEGILKNYTKTSNGYTDDWIMSKQMINIS